jgi:hypothetical protein
MSLAAKNRCTKHCAPEIRCMFKFSVGMRWHVPYNRPNLPAISVMAFHRSSLKILRTFSTFSSVRPVEGRPERLESSTEVSPCLNRETTQKFVFSPWHRYRKLISCVSDAVSPSLKQNFT